MSDMEFLKCESERMAAYERLRKARKEWSDALLAMNDDVLDRAEAEMDAAEEELGLLYRSPF